MKLSDAIEKGCIAKGQHTGELIDAYDSDNVCAIGAALLGVGKTRRDLMDIETGKSNLQAKDFGWTKADIDEVVEMNDEEELTFEEIIERLRAEGK